MQTTKTSSQAKLRVIAIGPHSSQEIDLSRLTALGGAKSSGFVIAGLKYEGDYLVLAPAAESISLHPLRGDQKRAQSLVAGAVFHLDDLTLYIENAVERKPDSVGLRFGEILSDLTLNRGSEKPLTEILSALTELCDHDHGLVASETISGSYEILATKNLDVNVAWLSETLVQEAMASKVPVLLQNVMGSDFDSQKSLMATKFLSVFCWPLVVQGKVQGVLLTASRRPYAGRLESVRRQADVFANFASVILDFRLRELRLRQELDSTRGLMSDRPFLTESPALIEVCDLARKLAPSPLSVLIQGETGVGKEVLSRWIHQQSDRKNGPFIALNCAAIPADLLESTLFGHKRGSFTGAVSDHIGKLRQANGGTLFLDEIGDLAPALQAKLLRVLQDGLVDPIGSSKSVEVDIRLICASHKNIRQLAQTASFRDDLYYRIAQVTLTLPPLRERLSDIRLLAREFLKEIHADQTFHRDVWKWLLSQEWSGNVRELKSAVQRASVLSAGKEILPEHFTAGMDITLKVSCLGVEDLESAKHRFVKERILQALEVTDGNKSKAAELLGVTPRTLFRYLEAKPETNLSQ